MPLYAFTDVEAIMLVKKKAQRNPNIEVSFAAIDYYWGPPVPGRFDTDFMRIWALAKGGSKAGAVFLQGKASNGEWSINEPFVCVETFSIGTFPQTQDFGIYHLKIDSQYGFPLEFVIRFESTAGPVYYDNNGSKNYQIIPYRRGVSAISVPQTAIFDMSAIVPCDLYATS